MFVGIDGCKSGWVVVAGQSTPPVISVLPDIQSIWQIYAEAERILIDIPIGFPEAGERACEAAARAMLQARRSSVFMVPVRSALYAATYAEASHINHERTGKKLSKQTWNIAPKMREVDQLLQAIPHAALLESHPEVVFTVLAGQSMRHSKKRGLGFVERLRLVERFVPDVLTLVEVAVREYRRNLLEDDVLDALVLWIAAGLPILATLPDKPQNDALGLPMQIVYPLLDDKVPQKL